MNCCSWREIAIREVARCASRRDSRNSARRFFFWNANFKVYRWLIDDFERGGRDRFAWLRQWACRVTGLEARSAARALETHRFLYLNGFFLPNDRGLIKYWRARVHRAGEVHQGCCIARISFRRRRRGIDAGSASGINSQCHFQRD